MADQNALLERSLAAIENLKRQVDEARAKEREPIAVVGMSCRFPGGADTPERYWELLQEGRSGITEVPKDRWDVDAYYDPDLSTPGTMYTRHGGFLGDLSGFDAPLFRISPREAATLDPQQRLLLECSWEALESAGEAPDTLIGSDTGVYVGITQSDYARLLRMGREDSDVYSGTGTALNSAAGRISFFLGVHGPCWAVDTACSSSLVAVHSACQALRAGECDRALAGGVNVMLSPEPFAMMSRWGMISRTGECRVFDDGASGFVRGEGCGMFVLKRLSDAIRDGDPIHATLLGSAVTQDGPSSGLSVPFGPAQCKAIRLALDRSNLQPGDVAYVEAHGTGTPIGDPIELEALGEVYGPGHSTTEPLLIGSVKSSIGHLESASGAAGLMKLVLSIREGMLARQLEYERPNSRVDWSRLPIRVVEETRAWPQGVRRVGAVSGFGFAGTNVHMLVGPAPDSEPGEDGEAPDRPRIVTLSARTTASLGRSAGRVADALDSERPPRLVDVERTLATGRASFPQRAAIVGTTRGDLVRRLRAFSQGEDVDGVVQGTAPGGRAPGPAFLFSGQGSQYPGMGASLRTAYPTFRTTMAECTEIVRSIGGPDLDHILGDPTSSAVHSTEVTQPALFCLEYALARLLQSWGVKPGAVSGHSIGEYVAACVAGVMSLEDALQLVTTRGRLMGGLPSGGGMLAVATSIDQALEEAAPHAERVSVAAHNGPSSVVLSGELDALGRLAERFEALGVSTRSLEVSHAFHSPLMEPMLDEWADAVSRVSLSAPAIPLASNVSGLLDPSAGTTPEYWVRHVREAVQFEPAMRALRQAGHRTFVEVGPRPVLLGMARKFMDEADVGWVPTLRGRPTEASDVLIALGALHTLGTSLDWEAFLSGQGRRIPLPTYPFDRSRHWAAGDPELPGATRTVSGGTPLDHPFLAALVDSPLEVVQVECAVDPSTHPLLLEHEVAGRILFPAAGYVELARAAGREVLGLSQVCLEDLRFERPLMWNPDETDPDASVVVRATIDSTDDQFTLYSRPRGASRDEPWATHARARIGPAGPPSPDLSTVAACKERCDTSVDIDEYRTAMASVGLRYGPTFLSLIEADSGEDVAVGRIRLPGDASRSGLSLHPGQLDAVFHLVGLAVRDVDDGRFQLPIGIDSVSVFREAGPEVMATCEIRSADSSGRKADIALWSPEGELVASFTGFRTRSITKEQFQQAVAPDAGDPLLGVDWRAVDPEADVELDPREWFVFPGSRSDLADRLVEAVERAGGVASIVAPDAEGDWTPGANAVGVIDLRPLDLSDPLDTSDGPRLPTERLALEAHSSLSLLTTIGGNARTGTRVAMVTRNAQRVTGREEVNPLPAVLWGVGVTASIESNAEIRLVDLDEGACDPAELLAVITSPREGRIARRAGRWHVARLTRLVDRNSKLAPGQPYGLEAERVGDFSSLARTPAERREPGPGEVEIAVLASGLNFRDVLNVLGAYPGEPGPLGNECAGRVVAVGEGVEGVSVGDLVTCIAEATFGSYVVASSQMVFPVPAELSVAGAAVFPIAYLTAYLSLVHLGGLAAGHRVLIHSATGGVGMAAFAIAKASGAEIHATAGTPEKRDMLLRMGAKSVWDSREPLPSEELLAATNGQGVNLVLNALIGPSIDEGIRSLAPGGTFLEIGLRDLRSEEEIDSIRSDIRYIPILLGDWCREQPDAVREMWRGLMDMLRRSEIEPPRVRRFPISEVGEAFQFMARAKHVGRLAVEHECLGTSLVRHDSSYVVTGGLGALGLSTADWLVRQGAGEVVLVSRRAPSSEVAARIDAMAESGALVRIALGDISDEQTWSDIGALVDRPIRGIIHAAGITRDAPLGQHDLERFGAVLSPKGDGAALIEARPEADDLDALVYYSSGSSVMGSAGQAAYSGANAFLDACAHRRRALGKAAVSVSWGAWEGDGMAAGIDARTIAQWQASGIERLSIDAAFTALDRAMGSGHSHVAVLPVRWATLAQSLEEHPAFLDDVLPRAKADERSAASDGVGTIGDQLREASQGEWPDLLDAWLKMIVGPVVGMDAQAMDSDLDLTTLGLDSMMALEIGNRIETALGRPYDSSKLLARTTLRDVVADLTENLDDTAIQVGADDSEKLVEGEI